VNELLVARTVYIVASGRLNVYYKENKKMGNEPLHVTDANFDETIKNNKVALIDFWAGWCGPCRALAPTITELASDYSGKVLVGKLDVDENPKTAECFQVFSIPTLVVFKDGCEAERLVGLCAKNKIEDVLKKYL
jgi:thioredoxin 1